MPGAEVFRVDFQDGVLIDVTGRDTGTDKPRRYSEDSLINDAAIAVAAVDSCYNLVEQGVQLEGVYASEIRAGEALDKLDQAQAQEAIQLARGTLF
jgi:hypothetical protein